MTLYCIIPDRKAIDLISMTAKQYNYDKNKNEDIFCIMIFLSVLDCGIDFH